MDNPRSKGREGGLVRKHHCEGGSAHPRTTLAHQSSFETSLTAPADPSFRSSSPGPGDIHDLRLHSGILLGGRGVDAHLQPTSRFHEAQESEECRHPQTRIVANLRYSLEQLKVASDRDGYQRLVDNVVVGPAAIKASDIEHLLGVNNDLYSRAKCRRKALMEGGHMPSWREEGNRVECQSGKTEKRRKPGGRTVRLQTSPERRSRGQDDRGVVAGGVGPQTSWRCPDLLFQFQMFSKFGESGSDGSQITLTQSDKWLRQAKVIDGWNVTTTDTAIAFRKISRGSIWLNFSHFREFLEELISRKGLNIQEVGLLSNHCNSFKPFKIVEKFGKTVVPSIHIVCCLGAKEEDTNFQIMIWEKLSHSTFKNISS